jgi:serine/threonine-protein kinase RsbW
MVAFRLVELTCESVVENIPILDQKYPSSLDSVDLAEAAVLQAANDIGFEEDDQHRIGMAFRECMVNAVVHGNRYNRNKHVHVEVTRSGPQLTMRITDEGEGFELQEVPDPLKTDNLLRHSGRGLFLMSTFMDDMKVRRIQPAGTEVTLVKTLAPPLSQIA